ncbi:unnamed protein product, partial [Lymnaea stagnalis]
MDFDFLELVFSVVSQRLCTSDNFAHCHYFVQASQLGSLPLLCTYVSSVAQKLNKSSHEFQFLLFNYLIMVQFVNPNSLNIKSNSFIIKSYSFIIKSNSSIIKSNSL